MRGTHDQARKILSLFAEVMHFNPASGQVGLDGAPANAELNDSSLPISRLPIETFAVHKRHEKLRCSWLVRLKPARSG